MKKKLMVFLLAVIIMMTTGCWDRIEINRRSYILGIGVDEYDEQKADISAIIEKYTPKNNFIFEVMGLQEKQGAGGQSSVKITVAANTLSQALDILETTLENPTTLTHLHALVISEEAAKTGIVQMVDFLIRNPQVRRRTKVYISQGQAREIFKFKPRISRTIGEYLDRLPDNSDDSPLVLVESDLETVSYSLANRLDFLIPRIYMNKGKNVFTKGGAVMNKNGVFLGWSDNKAFEGARLIRNLYRRGNVNVMCPVTKKLMVINIRETTTKIKTFPDMSVHVDISVRGTIASNLGGRTLTTKDYIEEVNKNVEKEIRDRVLKALEYFQKQKRADVFFFKLKYKEFHPQLWKEHKDNWEEVFPDIDVKVTVKANIRDIGTNRSLF